MASKTKKGAKRTYKESTFHRSVFENAAKAKRCGHRSKSGKVCSRFAGHDEKGRAGHFYVTPKELKAKESAWKERYVH